MRKHIQAVMHGMNTGSQPHCCLCVSRHTASELRIQSLRQLHYDIVPSSRHSSLLTALQTQISCSRLHAQVSVCEMSEVHFAQTKLLFHCKGTHVFQVTLCPSSP